jgi:hypothetical protein
MQRIVVLGPGHEVAIAPVFSFQTREDGFDGPRNNEQHRPQLLIGDAELRIPVTEN